MPRDHFLPLLHNESGTTILEVRAAVARVDAADPQIADWGNNRVRQCCPATRTVRTLAGSGRRACADGLGGAAAFNLPARARAGVKIAVTRRRRDAAIS